MVSETGGPREVMSHPTDAQPQKPTFTSEPEQMAEPERPTSSYFFLPEKQTAADHTTPDSPVDVARGAKSGRDLLRRLSLVDSRGAEALDVDPRTAYPALRLSGNVISATFCIPYQLTYGGDGDWSLSSRRGTSALFDSFTHLSNKTPWNHTLVGWTGEIRTKQQEKAISILQADAAAAIVAAQTPHPINKSAAPYPVNGHKTIPYVPHPDHLSLSRADRNRLEKLLAQQPDGKVLPVWLPENQGVGDGEFIFKDQSRWRKYAEHELYTLFHYRQHGPDDGRAEKTSWNDYVRMNQGFADRILQIYQPGDIVWDSRLSFDDAAEHAASAHSQHLHWVLSAYPIP